MGRDHLTNEILSHRTVSIHAPTWGATLTSAANVIGLECFNPRAHVGRDPKYNVYVKTYTSFNPRAHVGRDIIYRFSFHQ